jgi:hypothetical protein
VLSPYYVKLAAQKAAADALCVYAAAPQADGTAAAAPAAAAAPEAAPAVAAAPHPLEPKAKKVKTELTGVGVPALLVQAQLAAGLVPLPAVAKPLHGNCKLAKIAANDKKSAADEQAYLLQQQQHQELAASSISQQQQQTAASSNWSNYPESHRVGFQGRNNIPTDT